MNPKFNINTSQNVNIELKVAGVGDRIMAILIDTLIITGFSLIVFFFSSGHAISSNAKMILMALLGFFVLMYHFFFEWFMRGQTFGKRYRKIKVLHKSGREASVGQLLVRNLIRLIDSFYGLGLLVMFISKKSQRLGDLAAGTLVVKIDEAHRLSASALTPVEEAYVPVFSKLEMLRLQERDMELIKEIIQRDVMQMNWKLVGSLGAKIQEKAQIEIHDMKALAFLQTVLKDFQYYNGAL